MFSEDGDKEGSEDGEEEQCEDDDDDDDDAEGHASQVVKKKPSGHLRDQSKSKKFHEIYDDLPGDTKIFFSGIKGRGSSISFHKFTHREKGWQAQC